jgi:small subunit ribosomal protein S2
MAVVTMRQLLDAGVHFGHQTRRWNPKMKRFILTERNGIYIIDLQQTLTYIDRAFEFVKDTVAHGGTILFVGTKRQAQEAIAEQATRVNMPYVNQRWLGGMLTNFSTVHKRLQRLKDLEAMEASGDFAGRTKKEVLLLTREKEKLARSLGGIRDMARVPNAIWVVDTKKEHIAVGEARKLNIPVVAVLDTNCDPDEVDFPLPGNDDAIRSASLLTKVVAEAVAEGLLARSGGAAVAAGEEPLAEWERELLEAHNEFEQGQADLAREYSVQEGGAVVDTAPVAGLTDAAAEAAIEQDAIAAAIADVPATAPVADEPTEVLAETESGAVAAQQVAADTEQGVEPIVANEQESA